jgi:hypothetical protein
MWLRHSPGSRTADLQAPVAINDIRRMQAEIAKLVPAELRNEPVDIDKIRRHKRGDV